MEDALPGHVWQVVLEYLTHPDVLALKRTTRGGERLTKNAMRGIVVTASWDHTVKIWDLEQGKHIRSLRGHRGQIIGCSLMRSFGEYFEVATLCRDGVVRVWNGATGDNIDCFDLGNATEMNNFSCSHDKVAVGCNSCTQVLTMRREGKHAPYLYRQCYIPCRPWLYPNRTALSPDGQLVAMTSSSGYIIRMDEMVTLWDATTGTRLRALRPTTFLQCFRLKFAPDSMHLATCTHDQILIWHAKTGDCLLQVPFHVVNPKNELVPPQEPTSYHFSPDIHAFAWTSKSDRVALLIGHRVHLLDVATKIIEIGRFSRFHHLAVLGCAFDKDDKRLVTASADGTARVWDTASGDLLSTFHHFRPPIMNGPVLDCDFVH